MEYYVVTGLLGLEWPLLGGHCSGVGGIGDCCWRLVLSLRTPQAVKHFFAECSKIRLRESNGIEKLFDALVLPFDVVHLVVEVDADELIYISPTGTLFLQANNFDAVHSATVSIIIGVRK